MSTLLALLGSGVSNVTTPPPPPPPPNPEDEFPTAFKATKFFEVQTTLMFCASNEVPQVFKKT